MKVEAPAVVGVPVIILPFRFKPAGKLPDCNEKAYEPLPPVADNIAVYETNVKPLTSDAGLTVMVPQPTLSVKLASVVAEQLSVALTTIVWLPKAPAFVMETMPEELTVGATVIAGVTLTMV